jgi:hypothetical protein
VESEFWNLDSAFIKAPKEKERGVGGEGEGRSRLIEEGKSAARKKREI